jgi:anti-sigma regulatory factor (Ser/Thr protein kinase)
MKARWIVLGAGGSRQDRHHRHSRTAPPGADRSVSAMLTVSRKSKLKSRMAVTHTSMLARTPDAVRLARRSLDEWLAEHGCERRDDALLALSELVTNAVVHARGDPVVVMVYAAGRIRLEVHDAEPAAPVRRQPGLGKPGGFGLNIIDRLSEEWGCTAVDGGKIVWCQIRC